MLQLKKSIVLACFQKPFRESLELAAQLGVQGVEINARTELRASELSQTGIRQIRKWLSDYQLAVSCVQYPTNRGYETSDQLDERIEGTKQAMRLANDLGCSLVSNRIGTIPEEVTDPKYALLTAALNDLAAHSLKAGAWLALRTGKNSGPVTAELLKQLPQGAIRVDFDPAELMWHRHPPLDAMHVLGPLVAHFRARDAVWDPATGTHTEVQLGRGTLDLPALLSLLEEHHYRGYLSVERTSTDHPLMRCSQALEYLDHLFQ